MNILNLFKGKPLEEKLKKVADRIEFLKHRKRTDCLRHEEKKHIDSEVAELERKSGKLAAKILVRDVKVAAKAKV